MSHPNLDTKQLSSYVKGISNSELVEDISHLLEVNIVTSAIASTDRGSSYKLPVTSLNDIKDAFTVYRDELATRSFKSDTLEDTSFILLSQYYNCVKAVRSLSKYLNRFSTVLDTDESSKYSVLLENKVTSKFLQETVED